MSESGEHSGSLLERPVKTWPAWAVGLFMLMQVVVGVSSAYFASALNDLRTSIRANTDKLAAVVLALEGNKILERRMGEAERKADDHETRLRGLERVK